MVAVVFHGRHASGGDGKLQGNKALGQDGKMWLTRR